MNTGTAYTAKHIQTLLAMDHTRPHPAFGRMVYFNSFVRQTERLTIVIS